MSLPAILEIIAIAFLLVLSAFFSASDMAFSVVNPKHLLKQGENKKAAKLAYSYAKNYESAITTLLFSNALVNVIASSLGALLAIHLVDDFSLEGTSLGASLPSIISGSMLLLILAFGEILPKALAKEHPLGLSIFAAPLLKVFSILFFPIVYPSTRFAALLCSPIIKKFSQGEDAPVEDQELSEMFDAIEEEGIIDEEGADLLYSALEFKDTTAFEIMVPRIRVEGIERKCDLMKFIRDGHKFTHSRVPVYENSLDYIVGYIPVKALYKALLNGKKISIESLLTPILEVPKTMEISAILEEMKQNHRHIAVVKDEFGGTDGILTLEDILEELVGELWDENETAKEYISKLPKRNNFKVLGSCDIDLFFETFHIEESELEEGYETVSGFINSKVGGFAKTGDKVRLTRVDILVTKASAYTVEECLVIYHPRRKKIG